MRGLLQREQLDARVSVESAGTGNYHAGELPDRRARAAARARGVELTSRARQFVRADWDRFDYVLAMDRQNYDALAARAPGPEARAKLRLFRSFDPTSPPEAEVPDPFFGGDAGFQEVLDLCEVAGAGLIAHLRREHGL